MQVEGVEVVVFAAAIVRCLSVQTRDRAGEDRQLFASVVADYTDFAPYAGTVGPQRQLGRLDIAQVLRVVTEKPEVVHGITVNRGQPDFLVIAEDGLRDDRAGRHDMAVREDETKLGIHDEAGRLRGGIPLGVERPGAVDTYRHHTGGDPLERVRPGGIVGRNRGQRESDSEQRRDCPEFVHGAPDSSSNCRV